MSRNRKLQKRLDKQNEINGTLSRENQRLWESMTNTKTLDTFILELQENEQSLKDCISTLEHHKEILMSSIEETVSNNLHLADGEDCTLIALKIAMRKIHGLRG